MVKSVLDGMVFRSGVLMSRGLGYVIAGSTVKEESDIPHTIVARWKGGKINGGEAKFSAHTCCRIDQPEFGMIYIGSEGFYAVQTQNGVSVGNIFEDSSPEPTEERCGGIRWVSNIKGTAYAAGYSGHIFRMEKIRQWRRIDAGLPTTFNAEAIHGFNSTEIYAVGSRGALWQFDGKTWLERELPTNCYLTRVKCAANGVVFIVGHDGILLRGRNNNWEVIKQEATVSDLWGVEWFQNELYVCTMSNLYQLKGSNLDVVDFGIDLQPTCYHLSSTGDVMWVIGEDNIMSYNGSEWVRVL